MFLPGFGVGLAQLPGEDHRVSHFVHLQRGPIRFSIQPAILRKAAIGFLLHGQQVIERAFGGGAIARGEQTCGDFIQVARPDEMVAADGGNVRFHREAPRDAHRSDHRAAKCFIFVSLQHHRCQAKLARVGSGHWPQGADVFAPSGRISRRSRMRSRLASWPLRSRLRPRASAPKPRAKVKCCAPVTFAVWTTFPFSARAYDQSSLACSSRSV